MLEIGLLFQNNDNTGRPNLDAKSILGFLHVFASLSIIQPRKVGKKMSFKPAVPLNLLNMAENACIHFQEFNRASSLSCNRLCNSGHHEGKVASWRFKVCVVIKQKV